MYFYIGTYFGVPVYITIGTVSLILVSVLANTVFMVFMPWSLQDKFLGAVLWSVGIVASTLIHEYAHALAAKIMGYKVVEIQLDILNGRCLIQSDNRITIKDIVIVWGAGPLATMSLSILAF